MKKTNQFTVSLICALLFACGQKEAETPAVTHEEAEELIANPMMILSGTEKKSKEPCELRIINVTGDLAVDKSQFAAEVQAYFPKYSDDHHGDHHHAHDHEKESTGKATPTIQVTEDTANSDKKHHVISGNHKTKGHSVKIYLPAGATSLDKADFFRASFPHNGHHHKNDCLNLKQTHPTP